MAEGDGPRRLGILWNSRGTSSRIGVDAALSWLELVTLQGRVLRIVSVSKRKRKGKPRLETDRPRPGLRKPRFRPVEFREWACLSADRQRIAGFFPTMHRGAFRFPNRQRIAGLGG